jgi:hypothetical protein
MTNSILTAEQPSNLEEKIFARDAEKDLFALINETGNQLNALQEPAKANGPLCQKHIPALDALRGLAILVVTFYRFRYGPEDDSYAGQLLAHGLHWGAAESICFLCCRAF